MTESASVSESGARIDLAVFTEEDLLPLSGLQHVVFCERRCALVHLEQTWRENALTAEGRVAHERVDAAHGVSRANVRVTRGLPLRSLTLGLVGRADVVEFHRTVDDEAGILIPGLDGRWKPYPVEYKRGKAEWTKPYRVQLCGQALCLEEMLSVEIPRGALFYARMRRREEVVFDPDLRRATVEAARRFHEIMARGETPTAYRAPKCRSCSLLAVCLPPRRQRESVSRYLSSAIREIDE